MKRASSDYKVVWANQYEPERKKQFEYEIYRNRFPDTYISNVDISKVEKSKIPDINLVVGGFPCQDYSVMVDCKINPNAVRTKKMGLEFLVLESISIPKVLGPNLK
ncbi:DNA cytosine methyltransferase, partial [Lactiplantibacillus argentoratensis]